MKDKWAVFLVNFIHAVFWDCQQAKWTYLWVKYNFGYKVHCTHAGV